MEQARLVRWAVGMAIDKDTINTHLLNGLGWPVHVGYVDEKSEFWNSDWEYPYDPAMAEEYLDRAGYPRGGNGVRFEMPLFISSGHSGGLGEEIGDAIGGMMSDIGIKTEVLKFPYAVYRPGLVNRSATVPRMTSGDDGQTIYPFDWPKGIEESSLSRGGYCMCYETEWISRIYLERSQRKRRAEADRPQQRVLRPDALLGAQARRGRHTEPDHLQPQLHRGMGDGADPVRHLSLLEHRTGGAVAAKRMAESPFPLHVTG